MAGMAQERPERSYFHYGPYLKMKKEKQLYKEVESLQKSIRSKKGLLIK